METKGDKCINKMLKENEAERIGAPRGSQALKKNAERT